MTDITLATANSRKAKKYRQITIPLEDFYAKFEEPIRTPENVTEYQAMPKDQRDDVKDVGGFLPADLDDGRRSSTTVKASFGITLDADHADAGFVSRVKEVLPCQGVIYSTHSHTPEHPRHRLAIPLESPVSPDQYGALARLVANEIGMDYFDDTTYQPERLMYWPSCPIDGEYEYHRLYGPLLKPEDYLSKLADWRDVSQWPTSSRQTAITQRQVAAWQQDPLTKTGIVGAVGRALTIEDAIETQLSDVYEPSIIEGRYSYIPADSSSGLVTYDHKFAYSHHATDPACGRLLNAFDLIRVHKFPHANEQTSFNQMCEFAVQLDAVKAELAAERQARAAADFDDGNWETGLTYTKQGLLEHSYNNLELILAHEPALQNIRYNLLAHQIYATDLPWKRPDHPAWRDGDTAQLCSLVHGKYAEFSARNFEIALTKVSEDRMYHPIRDYLNALPAWDNVPRVETLFITYLGAEDTEYVRAVSRKTIVAAVARIRTPGIKFDSIPVLNGGQGIGKSTLIGKLGREWYSDSLSLADMKDKAAAEKLQGKWIIELSEMAGIKKMDVETVKSFASRTDDQYRPSYGRVVESHPRQTIIIGTTNNDSGFLRDVTGNRRFWPVRVTGHSTKRPWDLTDTEVDQIWAEALVLHAAGEELYLTGDIAAVALEEQRDALETDDRTGIVANYLETLLPPNWDSMDTGARIDFLRDPDGPTQPLGTTRREQVSNIEVWCECFENRRNDIRKNDSYEIEAMIKAIGGWKRLDTIKTGRLHIPIYGYQQIYVRAE